MEITKETLQQKLEEIAKQREQHLANANACEGAMQCCKQLLEHLSKTEVKKEAQSTT